MYSQQGLEKLNDNVTKHYFGSTNHRDKDALTQMLLKLNRLEELTDEGAIRPKQLHQCTLCKKTGHNSRTCRNTLQTSAAKQEHEKST